MERRPFLHATGIVLLATMAGALLFAVAIAIVSFLKNYTMTAADILPEDRVIALLTHADDAIRQKFIPWIPELSMIPASKELRTIAVLRLPTGKRAVVLFSRRKPGIDAEENPSGWEQRTIGPLSVSASSPDAFMLLSDHPAALGEAENYALLSKRRSPTESWIFLRTELLPRGDSLMDQVLSSSVFRTTPSVAILPREGSGATIEFVDAASLDSASILPMYRPQGTLISVATTAFAPFWTTLQQQVSKDTATVLQAYALTNVRNVFGENVSFEQHLLPLLHHPSFLSLGITSSGSLSLLLTGKADTETLPAVLSRFHASFRASLTTAHVVKRSFDQGRWTSINLRDDSEGIQERTTTQDGWTIQTTVSQEAGRGFCSAMRGNEFLLSTAEETLQSALRSAAPTSTPALWQGTLSMTNRWGLPSLLSPPSPLLPEGTQTVLWSIKKEGKITIVNISKGGRETHLPVER